MRIENSAGGGGDLCPGLIAIEGLRGRTVVDDLADVLEL
jgi:hypothetical protein